MSKELLFAEMLPIISEVLDSGVGFRLYAKGTSMLPTIREKVDSVMLYSPNSLEKGDIVLYKRDDGTFVLHRIVAINDGLYTMRGDNQIIDEPNIRSDQIIAVAGSIIRDDVTIDKSDRRYYLSIKGRMRNMARRLRRELKRLSVKILRH